MSLAEKQSFDMDSQAEPVSKDLFRAIMRRVAASVTVISAEHEGTLYGMTATAFSSVCADPPTVLIVVNKSTRSHPGISESGFFTVNILGADQQYLANRFGAKESEPYKGVDYTMGKAGPVLSASTAHLACKTILSYEVGTHTIFIATVIDGSVADCLPLIYHDGSYKAIQAIP
jgi:flavin reductase (DIM6/NTAB) family NADH-FMN oxidoreductase RutF